MIELENKLENAIKLNNKIYFVRPLKVKELSKFRKLEKEKINVNLMLEKLTKLCVFREFTLKILNKDIIKWRKYGIKIDDVSINLREKLLEVIVKSALGESFFDQLQERGDQVLR